MRQVNCKSLLLPLLLAFAHVASAAIAIGGNTSGGGYGSSVTTTGITTQASGSTYYAVWISTGTFGTGAVSDSSSNTWVHSVNNVSFSGALRHIDVWTCQSCAGGSGHTFTFNPQNGGAYVYFFIEVTGAATSSLDQNQNAMGSGGGTSISTTSVTTTSASELVLAMLAVTNDVTLSAPTSSFTLGTAQQDGGNGSESAAWAYRVVSATGTYSTSFTVSSSGQDYASVVMSFIQAGGGGGGSQGQGGFAGSPSN